jgi:hypothetical protein
VRYELGVVSRKASFFVVTAVKTSNLWALSGDVMCILRGMDWAFVTQKTAFFIVTAVKTSNFT